MELSNIALCLPDDIRTLEDSALKATNNDVLVMLINGFSEYVQSLTQRKLLIDNYTEIFDGGKHVVIVDAPPIVNNANFKVYEDYNRVFGSNTLLDLYEDISVDFEMGVIKRVSGYGSYRRHKFQNGCGIIKVVYDGGLISVSETEPTSSIFRYDLRKACALQVAWEFQSRKSLGVTYKSEMGNSMTSIKPTTILPEVETIIQNNIHFKNC